MSSLPQGWHNVPNSKKSSTPNSSAASSSATTIRKRWNSPQSSVTSKSRLPSYKRPTPSLPNGYHNHVTSTPATKSSTNSGSLSQNKQQDEKQLCPTKPPTRDYQSEINSLKKELTSVKAENSILKVKVRRVDDENSQKLRQVEKLRTEIKSLQSNNSLSNKRSKEPESILLLRQKCLRLEAALKEKDAALKKISNNVKTMTVEDLNDVLESLHKEIGHSDLKGTKTFHCNSSKSPSSSSARTSLSRASLSSKSEVTRLRDMLHKLQNENRELQQQTKEKDLEIRRLKIQFQRPSLSKDLKKPSNHVPNQKQNLYGINIKPKAPVKIETQKQKSDLSSIKASVNQKPVLKKKSISNSNLPKSNPIVLKTVPRPQSGVLNRTFQKSDTQVRKTVDNRPNASYLKQNIKAQPSSNKPKSSKLPMTKAGSTFVLEKSLIQPNQNVSVLPKVEDAACCHVSDEDVVQGMRENMAARKIQRGWRDHQKRVLDNRPQNEDKAIKFIVTALKHHRKRKEKLKLLSNKGSSYLLNEKEKAAIIQAVKEKHKTLWEPPELNQTF